MWKQNKSYTADFRREAIALAMDSTSVTLKARSLSIPEATLQTWVKKAEFSGTQKKD